MKTNARYLTLLAAFATCMIASSSAFADSWRDRDNDRHDRGNHYGHYKKYDRYDRYDGYGRDYRRDRDDHRRPVVVIRSNDRVIIEDYYRARPVVYYPGRHNNYYIRSGYVLPQHVVYQRIPNRLLNRLQPIPVGYEYVRVDNNVLLVQDATRLIVDVLSLN